MEKEKVLEIEITKINNEYSLAKVKKMNKKVIKEKEEYYFGYANSSSLKMNSVFYKNPNFYCDYSDTIECFSLCLNSENDCFTIKKILIKSLKLFLEEFNEKYGIPKRWRAEYCEKYYFITDEGKTEVSYEHRDTEDDLCFELGNYFQTEEEAQKVINSKEWKNFWAKVRNGEIGDDEE